MDFPRLHLPPAKLRLTREGEQIYVWCELRRKKLLVTPEEWVRQHLIHYLLQHSHIPKGKLVSEVEIRVGEHKRRCDLVAFNERNEPVLLVECKAPEISINPQVLAQAMHYNNHLRVPYLILSNGLRHKIVHFDYANGSSEELDDLPEWGEMNA